MSGRRPNHQLDVISEGANPIDVSIRNSGEADESATFRIVATSQYPPDDGDALRGCVIEFDGNKTVFATIAGEAVRLRPGEKRSVGWLRFAEPTNLRCELLRN